MRRSVYGSWLSLGRMRSTNTALVLFGHVCLALGCCPLQVAQAAFLSCSPTFPSQTLLPVASTKAPSPLSSRIITNAVSDMVNLDDSNRDIVLGDDKIVLVDAYAPWCGPCKLIEPVIERCAAKWDGKVDFVRYDVESGNNHKIKMEMLMQKTRIRKLPTLLLYHEGEIRATHSGLISYEELEVFLAEALHEEIHEDDGDAANRGKISFGSSQGRDDYALGP
mmetsp:Transcript_15379/g.33440  ORF Transcript_15379/g.33440 Transcript_15379/m.33440 type:complete len:222 (-) Transcript_15379:62-727(-)